MDVVGLEVCVLGFRMWIFDREEMATLARWVTEYAGDFVEALGPCHG